MTSMMTTERTTRRLPWRSVGGFARVATLAFIAVVACVAAVVSGQPGMPPALVVLDTVRQETLAQRRDATGEIDATRRSVLAAEEQGLITRLDLLPGDSVERGEVIASFDTTLMELEIARSEAAVNSARAEVAATKADRDRARGDWDRVQQLERDNVVTVGEIDTTKAEYERAEADLAKAEADLAVSERELDLTRERLHKMTVRAPFSGVVVSKQTEVGQWVNQGESILTLVDLSSIEVVLDIPERAVGLLSESDATVTIHVAALDKTFDAELIAIVPEADELSRLFPARFRVIDAAEQGLRPGMSVVGSVPTGMNAATITVHKDAIMRNEAGEFVFVDRGGTAAVAPLARRVFAVGDRVAVIAPSLREGERIVVEGNERLSPGRPLMVTGTLNDEGEMVPAAPQGGQ